MAAKKGKAKIYFLLGAVDQYAYTYYLAPRLVDGGYDIVYGATGSEDIIDNEDALTGVDFKTSSERPSRICLLGENTADSKLSAYFESQNNSAGGRAGYYLDVLRMEVGCNHIAKLYCVVGKLQNLELLPVHGGMQP